MRLTLIDLVVILGLFIAGGLSTYEVLHIVRCVHPKLLSLVGGTVTVLGLAWPIYRHFHFRPLCFPVCPSCRRMPDAYGLADARWPRAVLICSNCEVPLEIWMTRTLHTRDVSLNMPTFCLRWPEFIGLWRRVC